jgi:hypothetical protein
MKPSIFALAVLFQSTLLAQWTPPKNPNPEKILDEARSDRNAGRYADALAKHLWFHENALKYQAGMGGVRLSFALSDWVELGNLYPPALLMLRTVRDEAGKKVREVIGGHDSFQFFHDFASINEALEEQSKTTDLFVWLDANKSKSAKRVFSVAEPALIQSKQYRLCGKYIDADRSFGEIVSNYHMLQSMAKSGKFGSEFREFTEEDFSNSTATLVALLALNDHKADAIRIAEKALKEHDDAEFKQTLEKAKKGELPPSWPSDA